MNPTILPFAVLWLTVNTIWTSPLPARARSEQSHEFWNIFKVWIKQWDLICADSRLEWFSCFTQHILFFTWSSQDLTSCALFFSDISYCIKGNNCKTQRKAERSQTISGNKLMNRLREINVRNNPVPTAQAWASQMTQPWKRSRFPLARNRKPQGPWDKNNCCIPVFICFFLPY